MPTELPNVAEWLEALYERNYGPALLLRESSKCSAADLCGSQDRTSTWSPAFAAAEGLPRCDTSRCGSSKQPHVWQQLMGRKLIGSPQGSSFTPFLCCCVAGSWCLVLAADCPRGIISPCPAVPSLPGPRNFSPFPRKVQGQGSAGSGVDPA